jgi:hypothetical protein
VTALQQAEIEEFIMELLIARWRLGENIWPFNNTKPIREAMATLEAKGWLHWKGGVVQNTYNVFPTVEGIVHFTGRDYTPSDTRRDEVELLTKELELLRQRVREVAATFSAKGQIPEWNMVLHALGE